MIESDGQWIYISGRALNAKHRNADGSVAPWPFAADVCFNWDTPSEPRYFAPSESVNEGSTQEASRLAMYRISDTAENQQLLQLNSYTWLYYTGETLCELIKAFSDPLATWPFSAEIETSPGCWTQSKTIVAGELVPADAGAVECYRIAGTVEHYRIANTFSNNEILKHKGLVAARYFRAPGAPELASDAHNALDVNRNDETRWEWIYAVGEDLNTALKSAELKAWPINAERERFDRPNVWDTSAIVRFGAPAGDIAGTCDRYRFSVSFAALARNADLAKFVAAVQSETRIRATVNQASNELRTRKGSLTESTLQEAAQHAQNVATAMSADFGKRRWVYALGIDLNTALAGLPAPVWPVTLQVRQSTVWIDSALVKGTPATTPQRKAANGCRYRFRALDSPSWFTAAVQAAAEKRTAEDTAPISPKPEEPPQWVHADGAEMNAALVLYRERYHEAAGWPLTAEMQSLDKGWSCSVAVRFGNDDSAGVGIPYRFRVADSPGFYEALQAYRNARPAEAVRVDEPSPADAPAVLTPPRSDLQNAREQGPSAVEQARGIVRKVLTVLPDDFSGDEFPDAPRRRFRTRARPAPPSPSVEWVDLTEEP